MNNKKNWVVYLSLAVFGVVGLYLLLFVENTDKFDSQVKAYKIDPNWYTNTDDTTIYNPIFYFKVNGEEYKCETKTGSSTRPKESKNTVYYDSSNPTNCKTEYEKSNGKVAGVICLVACALIAYMFFIKKPTEGVPEPKEVDPEKQRQAEEMAAKAIDVANKIRLIYKRIIIGTIIMILTFFVVVDTAIFKQTIKARNYIETTATYVDINNDEEDSIFDNYIYAFEDKKGNSQQINISFSKDDTVPESVKIKYNQNNPQDFYEEGATFNKKGIVWYAVKVVALILLIMLFFNEKLLNKIDIFVSAKRTK